MTDEDAIATMAMERISFMQGLSRLIDSLCSGAEFNPSWRPAQGIHLEDLMMSKLARLDVPQTRGRTSRGFPTRQNLEALSVGIQSESPKRGIHVEIGVPRGRRDTPFTGHKN